MPRVKQQEDLIAIFVHAGAGFHSEENEKAHLDICNAYSCDLRHGFPSVRWISRRCGRGSPHHPRRCPLTNAGYGSNLNEQGNVECDASIVDHFGRSGAVGAVPNIRNPSVLARKIYDRAHLTDGISRIPPSLLVGEGATDFAWEQGIPVVPNDDLVSPHAHLRWKNWCQELAEFEKSRASNDNAWIRYPPVPLSTRLAHAVAAYDQGNFEADSFQAGVLDPMQVETSKELDGLVPNETSTECETLHFDTPGAQSLCDIDMPTQDTGYDAISDTVGAIAIDKYGNIAAGSSSGGIGMKHRGRVGPAALIGIGTHVMPIDPTDPEQTTVATVTSGTGEHIASSLAAQTCAMRLYFGQRKGDAGKSEPVTEEEAMREMIIREFIGHPAVANSEYDGSLGILAVKKTVDGIGVYFAHNTDSFALASMCNGYDLKPQCLMSRSPAKGIVAQGGLMFRPFCFYNGTKRKMSNDTNED
ncbi:hypothetical protein N7512_008551, partial [Penicillium capsulatum]